MECFNALSMTFGSGFNFSAGIDYYFGPCTLFKRGMKTPLPCGAVAPMEVVSFGGHKTLTYF